MAHTRPRPRYVLTLDAVYVLTAVAVVAFRVLVTPISPNDFWWHLALGRVIVQERAVPIVDRFSFTYAGHPFYDQGWLAQVLMCALHQLGGLPLLLLAHAAAVIGAYALLLWLAARRTGRPRLAAVLLILFVYPISCDNWLARPQSSVLPLFAGCLLLLTGCRLRWWRTLWPLVPLMLLWVNLHGSFPLGLALVALALLGEGVRRRRGDADALSAPEWRRLGGWGLAATVSVLANPRGPGTLSYVSNLTHTPAVTGLIHEWSRPAIGSFGGVLFFVLALGALAALLAARRRPDATDLLIGLAFLGLALLAVRSIVWFAMVAYGPLVCALGSRLGKEVPRVGFPAVSTALAVFLGMLLLLSSPWVRPRLGLPGELGALVTHDTPTAAPEWLRALPPSRRPLRLFHGLPAGSYLPWAAPEQRVFIDPRIELYPMEHHRDYLALREGAGAASLLAKYAVDGLLLDRRVEGGMEHWARGSGEWRILHEDDHFVLMGRAGRR